LRLNTQ